MARILLADDDAHTVRIMSLWLTRNGHQTLEARTGAAAVEILSTAGADMLISDINMPEINGLELVDKVRAELNLQIPIIVLSSRCDQTALANRLKAQGAELYPKPFVPSRLVRDIERLLEGRSHEATKPRSHEVEEGTEARRHVGTEGEEGTEAPGHEGTKSEGDEAGRPQGQEGAAGGVDQHPTHPARVRSAVGTK